MFRLYKVSILHDVNLSKMAELVDPPELLMPLVYCWAWSGLQALSFVALMGGSQELEVMPRFQIEQEKAQCALVASVMSTTQRRNLPW